MSDEIIEGLKLWLNDLLLVSIEKKERMKNAADEWTNVGIYTWMNLVSREYCVSDVTAS